jgi:cytochrome P450 family 628
VGGSDTTNSALLHLLYRLAKHNDVQKGVWEEIEGLTNRGEGLSAASVADMPCTTAVIFETLRLHPSAASGLPRIVPAEGATIDGVFTPPGTNIITPTYAIQRDPRYFMDAEKFVPERWTTKRFMVRDPRAFCPFGIGVYGCPGKMLALLEMKIVLASILSKFEIRKPKDVEWPALDRKINDEWKDCLTTQAAHIELCFVPR